MAGEQFLSHELLKTLHLLTDRGAEGDIPPHAAAAGIQIGNGHERSQQIGSG